jgi:formylglycine-generating enzyme required for sulfatase activity
MVQVNSFYVDSTEVTVDQYMEFLAAKEDDTSGQPAVCSWNTSYWDDARAFNPGDWPISYVDWCDARAYCEWAGKHLCGRIAGGPISEADLYDPAVHQWFLACGGPSGSTHPNTSADCNSNGGTDNLAPVGSFTGCEGFYPGLFDLEGNVAEWVDSCDDDGASDAEDTCRAMGGAIFDNQSFCTEDYDNARADVAVSYGLRCCSG